MPVTTSPAMAGRLVDTLHMEAMLLADEAGTYFSGPGRAQRDQLGPRDRVVFACESLKATTRTMQLIAWLTSRRAGETISLDPAADSDPAVLAELPSGARRLILAGIELHQRARRLAGGEQPTIAAISPARTLLDRLERAF